MKKNKNIEIITLGCSKNVVDSERLIRQLKANKFGVTTTSRNANTIIINTCGFIEAAKEESINTILEAVELKKKGEVENVIVMGCLSERYKKELRKEIPDVDEYFGVEAYEKIVNSIGGKFKKELLGERELTTPKHFAYLKISEGCNNPCSFCAIPIMRGKHRSKPQEHLLKEAASLANKGVKELIIIGQDTTDYGIDIYGKRTLAELLNKLSKIEKLKWIRLMYAYPSHFPQNLMNEIANNEKILNYIDLPLQHISENILKSMRRGISKRRTIELIELLRSRIPNLTLRTTLIVGYPGETERDFNELYDFVKETEFDRMGVFTYSQEEQTPAYALGDPVPAKIKEERQAVLMELQKGISLKKNSKLKGEKFEIIVDSEEEEFYLARSAKDAPEVDCEVLIPRRKNKVKIGNIYTVEIYDFNEYDLFGNII